MWCRFVGNVCTCTNGVAKDGSDCPVNAAAQCKSCNAGWTINHAGTECIGTSCASRDEQPCKRVDPVRFTLFRNTGNLCVCNNGVAQSFAGCPANGAAKCKSCNAGWTINHAATECIGMFNVHGPIGATVQLSRCAIVCRKYLHLR